MSGNSSILGEPKAIWETGSFRLSATWRHSNGNEREVFFEIEASKEDLARIQPHSSAFVVALIVPAMERGEDLHIEAPVDPDLLDNLNAYVVPLLLSMFPRFKPISVTASGTDTLPLTGDRRAASTGMSCGIDSLATLGSSKSHEFFRSSEAFAVCLSRRRGIRERGAEWPFVPRTASPI